MADGGYIKLWRRITEWPVWKHMTGEQRAVVIQILLDANWRDGAIFDRSSKKLVQVPRGSFVLSQRTLAERAGVGRRVVRTVLELLKTDPGDGAFLTHDPTHSGAVFSVNNYDRYQGLPTEADPTTGPQPAQSPTQARPKPDPLSLYEEGEEGEEEKKEKHGARKRSPRKQTELGVVLPTEAWSTAKLHQALLLKREPEHPAGGATFSLQRWAREYDAGQRTSAAKPIAWESITSELTWALELPDPYWCGRLSSPGAFFRARPTIRSQMEKASQRYEACDRPAPDPDDLEGF